METYSVASTSQKRNLDKNTNWSLCFICQDRDQKKGVGTRVLTEAGISRIELAVTERKRYNDVEHCDTIERLENISLREISKETNILNHKDCYTTFTSSLHINRLKTKFERLSNSIPSNNSSAHEEQVATRSAVKSKLNANYCIFCQQESSKKTYLITRLDASNAVLEAAQYSYDMRYRLAGISDLVAAKCKYHLNCYVNFKRGTSFIEEKENKPDPSKCMLRKSTSRVVNWSEEWRHIQSSSCLESLQ